MSSSDLRSRSRERKSKEVSNKQKIDSLERGT